MHPETVKGAPMPSLTGNNMSIVKQMGSEDGKGVVGQAIVR